MMESFRILMAMLVLATAGRVAQAQIALSSDVGVTLTAASTTNLATGQPIDFALSVTNYGPNSIPVVEVSSSIWVNQIFPISFDQNECYLVVSVEDGITPTYFMSWVLAGLPGEPDFAAGETLTCHSSLSLTASAPARMLFGFGLPNFITDSNPDNDIGTVILQRTIEPIPALSAAMLLLLTGTLAAAADIVRRYRMRF